MRRAVGGTRRPRRGAHAVALILTQGQLRSESSIQGNHPSDTSHHICMQGSGVVSRLPHASEKHGVLESVGVSVPRFVPRMGSVGSFENRLFVARIQASIRSNRVAIVHALAVPPQARRRPPG